MEIQLKPENEAFAAEQAVKHGLKSPSAYVEMLIRQDRLSAESPGRDPVSPAADAEPMSLEELKKTKAWAMVESMRGKADFRISADQIMDETRSEV